MLPMNFKVKLYEVFKNLFCDILVYLNDREEVSFDGFLSDSFDNLFILNLFTLIFLLPCILGLIEVLTAISGFPCILDLFLDKSDKETVALWGEITVWRHSVCPVLTRWSDWWVLNMESLCVFVITTELTPPA